MKYIDAIIREVDSSLRKIDFFFVVVKSLVVLMVSYLSLYLIGLPAALGFIPALIYFFSSYLIEFKMDQVKRIEKYYPYLNEKLRTARDYKNKDNFVLQTLEEDIVQHLKEVKLSTFFPFARAIMLISLLVVSVSASIFIASKNLQLIDVDSAISSAMKKFTSDTPEKAEQTDFTGGDVSVMEVGNERIEVEINPVGIDFDFSEVKEAGDYEFSTSFPQEVFLSSGAAYGNEFTDEQQALIKRYFEKKKIGGK